MFPLNSVTPSDAEVASQVLSEENSYRFPSFTANEAVALGLSIRKRFRASTRSTKEGRGMLISIQTISGQTLFSCTVDDLMRPSSAGDVSLGSWSGLQNMIKIVRDTSHSTYYVEKVCKAKGEPAKMGDGLPVCGGAFPIWLESAACCPFAVVACYSGSSFEDHRTVATTIRDYLHKMRQDPVHSKSTCPSEIFPQPTYSDAALYVQTREESSHAMA